MGMMKEQGFNKPVNLGSGNGVTIKEIAETIAGFMDKKCEIQWI